MCFAVYDKHKKRWWKPIGDATETEYGDILMRIYSLPLGGIKASTELKLRPKTAGKEE